jgi:deferrochelatase/peroxidase EfeB
MSSEMTRRSALKALGLATASAVAGGAAVAAGRHPAGQLPQVTGQTPVVEELFPFEGVHQAGIITDPPEAVLLVALEVISKTPDSLTRLMQTLTARSRELMRGQPGPATVEDENFPPRNTGEMGYDSLKDGRLSIMIGLGASLFTKDGKDRFGLASRKPIALKPMPRDLAGDRLNPAMLDGDILLQISSDHPLQNLHAFRDILRNTKGLVSPVWVQPGFQRYLKAPSGEANARGLLGFKDGTSNLNTRDDALMTSLVWTGSEEPGWAQGGTYVAVRIIREQLERWDRLNLARQEASIGRRKTTGATLDNTKETTLPNYAADPDGDIVPLNSHIRKSNPHLGEESERRRMLRRGFLYMNGIDKSGLLDAGFLFQGFCRNLEEQFEFVKRNYMVNRNFPKKGTGAQDLDEYTACIGGGYFFVPAGVQQEDRFLADALLSG